MIFTPAAEYRQHLTREQRVQQLGQRWSKTAAEREAVALAGWEEMQGYEMEGGRYSLTWFERTAGLSHSTAVNIRDAGRALARGATPGQGVTQLAYIGRQLAKGKTLAEAQTLATDAKARKEAAAAAGIDIGRVAYPEGSAEEMAQTYAELTRAYAAAGEQPPGIPEMTLTLARIARRHISPATIQQEATGASPEQAEQRQQERDEKAATLYSYVARQGCCICGDPDPHIHHVRLPDLQGQAGGRRYHDSKAKELVLPLCPRHHQHAREAVHNGNERQWAALHFGHEYGHIIHAARLVSGWAEEQGALK